ncbi:hypothetical protein LCGC14_1096740 [marine sediment metagenome]|uniref:Rrf2 family transcriptional regulator n=1 Tax=marine sediment metagenome TaxID=412755 RepID=A0A0F9MF47_9ZZZZ
MKIFSEKIKYGLAALFELAKNYNVGHIQIRDIAVAQNIPQNYLEHFLIKLKESNLVESVRGSKGGYKLKLPANSIKVLDIIESLEGDITVFENPEINETLNIYWDKIKAEFRDMFNNTLEDLINEDNIIHKRLFFQI